MLSVLNVEAYEHFLPFTAFTFIRDASIKAYNVVFVGFTL